MCTEHRHTRARFLGVAGSHRPVSCALCRLSHHFSNARVFALVTLLPQLRTVGARILQCEGAAARQVWLLAG
jgi:hypothetical protein